MLDERIDATTLDMTPRQAITTSRADRTRALDALHGLEFCAATAAPGRETDWIAHVRDALGTLEDALSEQERNSAASDSPLSGIEHEEPRLWNRVVQLRQRYRDLANRVSELRTQLDSPTPEGIDRRHPSATRAACCRAAIPTGPRSRPRLRGLHRRPRWRRLIQESGRSATCRNDPNDRASQCRSTPPSRPRRADLDRTLHAIHCLEAALGSAAPGREDDWLHDVLTALTVLSEATVEEQHNANQVDSMLSDIARTQPRLRNRVRGLRTQYQQVRDTIGTLRGELAGPREQASPDFADIRQRLAWLLTALRHQRSRESDLIYEAYYDAFKTDIETDGAD